MGPVETFQQVIDKIIEENQGNPLLWYNWLTSRDRLNPGFWQAVVDQQTGQASAPPRTYSVWRAITEILFRATASCFGGC